MGTPPIRGTPFCIETSLVRIIFYKKVISSKCKNCGREIEISKQRYKRSKTKHFFCSLSCAATYNNKHRKPPTETTKARISEALKKRNKEQPHGKEYVCKVCGKRYMLHDGLTRAFCSERCQTIYKANKSQYVNNGKLREGGLKSVMVQAEKRRSKNEIEFFDLCKRHFSNVSHNEQIFNGWDADVIIHDIKYAILWNGAWHYKQIKKGQSLPQIQTRDKIKIEEIRNCGYTPYVIRDMGKYNKRFVKEEFDRFLKNIS